MGRIPRDTCCSLRSQLDEEHGGDHGKAHQQHRHLGHSVPGGAELVRQNLHEGDVDEGSRREPLQRAASQQVLRGRLGLSEADAQADAQRWHEGKQQQAAGHRRPPQLPLAQLEGQAEGDDALVDHQRQADLQDVLPVLLQPHSQTLKHRVQRKGEDQDEGAQGRLRAEIHVEVAAAGLLRSMMAVMRVMAAAPIAGLDAGVLQQSPMLLPVWGGLVLKSQDDLLQDQDQEEAHGHNELGQREPELRGEKKKKRSVETS